MFRVSQLLTLTRVSLEEHTASGEPLPADVAAAFSDMLRLCAAQSELMERRLKGHPVQHDACGSNVVSLEAWAARKGIILLPSGGDVA